MHYDARNGSDNLGQTYLAIVNPAAGGGRSRKLLGPALERLRAGGIEVKVAATRAPGQATEIAREAYGRGVRNFIAVGGDGTSYEVVNGLFPQALERRAANAGFLAAGHGQFFSSRFQRPRRRYAIESLLAQRSRPCDVMRLRHRAGVIHYINLLSMGFSADVATLARAAFQCLGRTGICHLDLPDAGAIQPPPVSGASRRRRAVSTIAAACS